jgi:meso-butanediol dehydrogenase/(S,S)-butanediol dehydrogenase/diacetyl reductase
MGRLAGKITFITGVSSGQGQAAARLFAREGALVFGCYRSNTEGAAATQRMVDEVGGRMILSQIDASEREAVQAWINDGAAQAGGLDILYNNAAGVRFQPFPKMSVESWSYTLHHELDNVFHATQAAWPHMLARGAGSIINIASTAGIRGRAQLGAAGHATGKAGLAGLTRQLAAEGAKHQIRANTISPGAIATPGLDKMDPVERERVIANIPLGRVGQPEDIAYCALYLASDEAAWVTAQHFVIDGGSNEIK